MTKICEWCKCDFETQKKSTRFCSGECAAMAHRKHCFLKREAWAKELGVTIEEVERLTRSGLIKHALEAKRLGLSIEEEVRRSRAEKRKGRRKRVSVSEVDPKYCVWIHRPKTYAEIARENRARKVVSGWRGAPVMGGGSVRYNDGDLKQSEL